jgi:hypothetical protein
MEIVQVAAHSIHLTSFVDDYNILWYDYGNDMVLHVNIIRTREDE